MKSTRPYGNSRNSEQMDNEKIEKSAVNAIETEVLKYPRLHSHLQTADKIPSWDGELYVYNEDKHTKENLSGIINVQVKGKLAKDLTQPTISYPLDVADLVNYRAIQGALLFVVLINPEQPTQRQIYYAPLLPADLEPLLKEAKNKTGQKTIHCVRLRDGHPNLEDICVNFIMDEQRQKGQASDIMMTLQEAADKSLSTCLYVRSQPQHLLDNLFNAAHCVYARYQLPNDKVIDIPITTRGYVQALQRKITLSADNKKIAAKIPLTIRKGNITDITVAPNLTIQIAGENLQVNYKEQGSIQQRIKITKIMKQICEASSLEANGQVFARTIQPQTEKATALQYRVEFLEDLDRVLKFWGVKQPINFDALTPACMANVNALATALSTPDHQLTLPQPLSEQAAVRLVKIANLAVLVLFIPIKDNVYALENFFNLPNQDFSITVGSQQIPTSRYIILNSKQYGQASNIPWDHVKQDLCSVPFSTIYSRNLNNTLLTMLTAYDSCPNPQLFAVIKAVSKYLIKHEPNSIYNIINRAQVIQREKPLSKTDKDILLKIQAEQTDVSVKLGVAVLLKQPNLEELYAQLNSQQRKDFDSWPISHLWERK